MVKSKFPGKPSKLVQRTLVSAFSVAVPSCDTSTITENVCYGLSVFENAFGDEEDDLHFVGFNEEEIEASLLKKEKLLSSVTEKFSARGLRYTSTNNKKHIVSRRLSKEKTEESGITLIIAVEPEISRFSNETKKERRKCGKIWFVTKKMVKKYHPKIALRHNLKTLNKNSLLRFKHKSLSSNYLSDKFRRKFIVPSRSLHSSRVIKPTKRFIESQKYNRITRKLLKNKEYVRNDVHDATINDDKPKIEVSSNKVIIREARLNITTEPAITGPFSVKKNISYNNNNNSNSIKEITRKENSAEKEHFALRGPRVKHVCRSASSVLRTSLENEYDLDDSIINLSSVESNKLPQKVAISDTKIDKGCQLNRIRQCGHNNVTLSDNQRDSESSSQHQGARSLQDFTKESSDESEEREDKLISIDYWEAYDPDEVYKTGFPVISSEPLNVRALCFLCGSAGMEKFLYCVACCEPYHWYCAEGPSAFREEAELEKCRVNWICRKCKVCSTCGKGGDLRTLSSCKRCRKSYHTECLSNKALNKRLFKSDRPWVCPLCLKCKSCNSNTVFTHIGNIPLCSQCFKLRQKGNYCPLCQGCYQDEDYNVQMMECGICKCWIHAKCEGISYEKYQILSFLPDSIEFVCRLCCSVPPAQWWLAVEDELKAGFYGVLKSLCNNKKIGDLLKESPHKERSPCFCDKRHADNIDQTFNSPLTYCKRALNFEVTNETVALLNGSPSAKLVIDQEVSSAELQKCSSCYCNVKIRNSISERLLAIKANVRTNQYRSVFLFNQQLEDVLAEVNGSDSISKYREILKQFFPWFDPEHTQHEEVQNNCVDTVIKENSPTSNHSEDSTNQDDEYAELRKRISADEYKYENFRMLDVRRCNLCKGLGEAIASEGGRLIYCGRNEWVHSNCALWSSEVFEEIDGSLQNVHSAISRGRQIRCSACDKKGASVGCCFKNCTLTYHFLCAKKSKCVFIQNKTIYCNNHDLKENNLQLLVNEKDFEILRPVYIEMDRKKKKLECHANVKLRIGSLHVESLGKVDPHLSDKPQYILPMYFRCTRLFWSTKKPWKIVQYHIQIKMSYFYEDNKDKDVHYTVDHSVGNTPKMLDEPPAVNDTEENPSPPSSLNSKSNKRKIDFEDSLTPVVKKKIRENRYLSAAKLNHVVVDCYAPFEKLVQLDGMIDIYAEEEPVTCAQCQRTYRTTFSYERHLDTCNSDFGDFMISSCESDSVSSEEDKLSVCSINAKIPSLESIPITEVAPTDATFVSKYTDTYIIENNDKLTVTMPTYTNNLTSNMDVNSVIYPCAAAMAYEDGQLMNNTLPNTVTLVQNLKQDTVGVMAPQPVALPVAAEPTIKFNIVDNSGKIATCNTNYSAQLTPQSYSIQNVTSTPTYVIQPQYQKPAEMIPTFLAVDNTQPLQQIQLQSFTQPSVSFQSVVPTILGAVVQPNIIETTPATTYIMNASTPTDLYATQNVILPSQPVIFGVETVVSNTVMSSSHQFMAQSLTGANIGSSTLYSTTTTQVFQAAKQLPPQPDLSSGYIVLNTPVSQGSSSIQTIQTAPAPLEVQPHIESQVTVVSGNPANKYMYLQMESDCSNNMLQMASKKLPPVIVKPATKPLLPVKKNTKVMKVKNNRPVAIQTADNLIPLFSNVNEIHMCTAKEVAAPNPTLKMKNLQIKTTDKAVLCHGDRHAKTVRETVLRSNIENAKTEEPVQMKVAQISVNERNIANVSCQSVNVPTLAEVINSSPIPTDAPVEKRNEQNPLQHSPDVQEDIAVTILNERAVSGLSNFSADLTEEAQSTPLRKETSSAVLNGKKIRTPPLSIPINVPHSFRDTCETKSTTVVNGKKIASVTAAQTTPSLLDESVPVVFNERNVVGLTSLSINLTRVDEEKKSAPSMPLLDLLDETNVQNKENAITEPSTKTSLLEPVLRKCMPKILCKSSEPALPKSMPLLEPVRSTVSETDRIFDELLRQHKLSLENKSARKGESSIKNTIPNLKLREGPNLEVLKKTEVVTTKKLKKSPDPKEKKNVTANEKNSAENKSWKTASISFEVNAEDGFTYKTNDLHDLWNKILESVQHSRNEYKLPLLPKNALVNAESVYNLLGFENNASKYLLEQLPDAWKCIFYKPVFHKSSVYGKMSSVENVSGCARTEPFTSSHKFDMFGWLASRHRKPPKFMMVSDSDIVNGNRRITSLNLPMAMRFRHLKETAKETVGVFRSDIHGRGLFCLRDIDAGEMVIEYAGEVIRSTLTDKREKYYTSKGIGCYMFRIDDRYVVDATMCGNAARFINHSCDPNCYSRIVDILGKKHILIFALRRIPKGEELTYDYKFPLEEDKIHCHCLARKCRKYLN